MRCDCCPLCPIAEDDVCPESEGRYAIEHADGMWGCKHPYNWAKKRSDEYCEYLGEMGDDMGIEMRLGEEGLKQAIEICKHMIGLDYKKPYRLYHRHGKAFYKPYRNYYEAPLGGDEILDKLPYWMIDKKTGEKSVWYKLTDKGLKWLGRQLKIGIKGIE